MSEEEEYEYVDDEPADEEEDEGGLPAWLVIPLGLLLFVFMTWCGYVSFN